LSFNALTQDYLIYENSFIRLSDDGLKYFEKTLPTSVDLSGSTYWPPIYQQTHWVCNQVASSYYMLTYETNLVKDITSASAQNQFSVYFPWNFGNGGYGWFGDNYVITMEMIKKLGVPKHQDCMPDQSRDSSVWISGYDTYFNAMHNRIKDYYGIKVNTIAGLATLKSWVYNHGGSDYYGGTATFLANIASGGDGRFAAGTPEEGDYVIQKCGNNALHARTIVGYSDLVCFDYNNDGQYTNNLDLNGDGIIDVRDYEKGGFKLAESFGAAWNDGGYCWIMYKAMADAYGEGGILNNTVHVIQPWIDYSPKLTAKIKIKHDSREKIKVKIGISDNLDATTYDYIQDFPILNFQGGNKFMQGGITEESKTIEVGLDLTPYLEFFNSSNCAKLFLVLIEADNQNASEGEIQEFTIIDYTGVVSHEFSNTDIVSINNNASTIVSLDVCANTVNAPKILTESLPVFSNINPIWFPLSYDGGTAPFTWEILPFFDVTQTSGEFDAFSGTKLTPDSYFNGDLSLEIPFAFPFNNQSTNKIKINSDGYIFPFNSESTWTQLREHLFPFFINENVIAPLARFSLVNDYSQNDGIWYKFVQDTVKIRWNSSEQNLEPWTNIDFSCNLISDGSVEFNYGARSIRKVYTNIGGISYGQRTNYILSFLDDIPQNGTKVRIKPFPKPQNLNINIDGILYGDAAYYQNYPFLVKITDSKGISHTVKYEITTGIEDVYVKENNPIEIFPNPATLNFQILIRSDCNDDALVTIFDNAGSVRKKFNLQTNVLTEIDISEFQAGAYTINVVKNGITFNRVLIVI
jgi:hypothetical protein